HSRRTYDRLNSLKKMAQRHDVHRKSGITAAQLSDCLLEFVRIAQAHENMGQLVCMMKTRLRVAQPHVNKRVLRAVGWMDDSCNSATLFVISGQAHAIANVPAIAPSRIRSGKQLSLKFREFSFDSPGPLERQHVRINS